MDERSFLVGWRKANLRPERVGVDGTTRGVGKVGDFRQARQIEREERGRPLLEPAERSSNPWLSWHDKGRKSTFVLSRDSMSYTPTRSYLSLANVFVSVFSFPFFSLRGNLANLVDFSSILRNEEYAREATILKKWNYWNCCCNVVRTLSYLFYFNSAYFVADDNIFEPHVCRF